MIVRDPRVREWLWPHMPAPQPQDLLRRFVRHWDEHRFGPWVFSDDATGEVVGYGGLQRTTVEGSEEVEVLYAVASARWGEGSATQIANEAVRFAFDELGFERLVCFTRTDNLASRRVMEKAGFRYRRDFERAGLPHALYTLGREE